MSKNVKSPPVRQSRDAHRSRRQRDQGHHGRARHPRGRRGGALDEDQEFPLARLGPALPRLSPAARRAVRPDLRDDRSDRRARRASSAARRCIRSARSRSCSACSTTTPTTSTPQDMLAELREDNKQLAKQHARAPRGVRRAQRHRHREPDRELGRRDRAAHLVPVRGGAQRPSAQARRTIAGTRSFNDGAPICIMTARSSP